jgi:hypothetical protein
VSPYPAKTVRWKGKLTEFLPSDREAVPEDHGPGLPNSDKTTVQMNSAPPRDDFSSEEKEEPLTPMQKDFVTMGKYPDKYPVQKRGEPDNIMVTRSGKSRSKYLMPGGLAMGCSLNYVA